MSNYLVVKVFALLCLTSYASAAQARFTATPTIIKHLLTKEMHMMCSVNPDITIRMFDQSGMKQSPDISDTPVQTRTSTAVDIQHVSSLIISRDGADIAVVSEHSPVSSFDNITGLQVIGEASGNNTGFLQVNWTLPGPDQAGNYECRISGLDAIGHPVSLTQSLVISENEISIEDMVKYVNSLQRIIDVQNSTIDTLSSVNSQQQSTIDKQHTDIESLKSAVAQIQKNQNTNVLFTVGVSNDGTLSASETVKFDQVLVSLGGGYSTQTGIFTCPISGYYLFHITILGQSGEHGDFDLMHNGKYVVPEIVDDNVGRQSASNTAFIKLAKGDTVYVMAFDQSKVDGNNPAPYTTFTGQLVALV